MRLSILSAALAFGLAFGGAAHAERLTDQPLVDAAWLKSHAGNESLVILDIRDADKKKNFYAEGHIANAIHAPYGAAGWRAKVGKTPGMLPPVEQLEKLISSFGVSNDEHVVIVPFGQNSSDFGSATRVYWTFKVLGHDAVSILDGGYKGWVASGGELTTDAPTPVQDSFKANFRPEYLATETDVKDALKTHVALVDGRPADQFVGKAKSPVARVPGTIPGAVNIENSAYYDEKAASFVSSDIVKALSRGVGLDENEEAIAFCNTGHWASVIWFGLSEIEGNKNVKMYDGSLAEWTADTANPVQ